MPLPTDVVINAYKSVLSVPVSETSPALSNINAEYPGGGRSAVVPAEKPKPKKTTTTGAPKHRSQDQFFKNRDRNGDGAITLEEFIGNPKGRNVPALTKRFKKIDSNGDGKLRLNELKKETK
jgi:hypothetical protein